MGWDGMGCGCDGWMGISRPAPGVKYCMYRTGQGLFDSFCGSVDDDDVEYVF